LLILPMSTLLCAQRSQRPPLTNQDVIKMVAAGLAEPVVVATIQASPANYDTSPDGLIALQKAGVTQNEMTAMMAGHPAISQGAAAAAPVSAAVPAADSAPEGKWQMPSVALLQSGGSRQLPMERTQLVQTRTKPQSLSNLAGDTAVAQGIQAGVNDAAWDAATHMQSGIAGAGVMQAGSIFGSAMSFRQPTVTYVWGVSGQASANILQTTAPKFSVNFARAPGVKPAEFAPQVVKLTPTQGNSRLVGATQGKEDARSRDAADWKIYSSFVEDRVAVKSQETAPGQYEISPQSPLLPGEYAIVLRPVSRDEKVSGGDVARAQGPGLMFDILWSFQVANTAQ
jgi:hypothetical protein